MAGEHFGHAFFISVRYGNGGCLYFPYIGP